jgi:peptide/nickel transport system substrate-binding protein
VPYLDEIRYRPIPDATVALTELKTHNIDFFFGIDPKDVEEVSSTPDLQYLEGHGVGYQGLWINTAQGPLANKALREAVAFAVDRDALFAAAYYGVGQIAHGPIPPSSWAYDPDFVSRPRDLEQARAKLAEGGQPDGFPMNLMVANTPLGLIVTQIVQANLAEVGIEAEIQTLEFGALLEVGAEGAFDALSLGWSGRIDPDGNIQPIFHTSGAFNYGKYNNPQVDQLIADGRATSDQAERTRIYQEIQRIINEDAAYVFTYFQPASFGAVDAVHGFTLTPDALMRFRTTCLDQS